LNIEYLWKSLVDKSQGRGALDGFDPEFLEWSETAKRPVSPLDGAATEASLLKVMEKYDGLQELFKRYIK